MFGKGRWPNNRCMTWNTAPRATTTAAQGFAVSTGDWRFAVKHGADRVIAVLALVVLAPALLAIALAVRLSSSAPVLFRQRRVGKGGRVFDLLQVPDDGRRTHASRLHPGRRPRARRGRGLRSPDPCRSLPAVELVGRATTAPQRAAGRDESDRSAARATRVRGAIPRPGPLLRGPPAREVRNHGLGAGERSPRPDLDRRPRRV